MMKWRMRPFTLHESCTCRWANVGRHASSVHAAMAIILNGLVISVFFFSLVVYFFGFGKLTISCSTERSWAATNFCEPKCSNA